MKRTFTADNLPQYNPLVRGQKNGKDCGIFLLQYVQSFFSDGLERDWTKEDTDHSDLFTRDEVNRKRGEIAKLLRDMTRKQYSDRQEKREIKFPNLNFVPEESRKRSRRVPSPQQPSKVETDSPESPSPRTEESQSPELSLIHI